MSRISCRNTALGFVARDRATEPDRPCFCSSQGCTGSAPGAGPNLVEAGRGSRGRRLVSIYDRNLLQRFRCAGEDASDAGCIIGTVRRTRRARKERDPRAGNDATRHRSRRLSGSQHFQAFGVILVERESPRGLALTFVITPTYREPVFAPTFHGGEPSHMRRTPNPRGMTAPSGDQR
jgi:hypothetical protein